MGARLRTRRRRPGCGRPLGGENIPGPSRGPAPAGVAAEGGDARSFGQPAGGAVRLKAVNSGRTDDPPAGDRPHSPAALNTQGKLTWVEAPFFSCGKRQRRMRETMQFSTLALPRVDSLTMASLTAPDGAMVQETATLPPSEGSFWSSLL